MTPNIRTSRIIHKGVLTALFIALMAPLASAQTYFDFFASFMKGRNAANYLTAVNTDVAFLIKYTGTQNKGIVDVAANGDITLKHGVTGSEVVDTTVECDSSIAASGSRSGIIDVSDSACDTVGEVMNIINSQSTNWVIVPIDALLSDDLNAGGSGALVTITGSSASVMDGLALVWDTATRFASTIALLPPEARKIRYYLSGVPSTGTPGTGLKPNPYAGLRTVVGAANATSTYGSGSSSYRISQEVPLYNKSGTSTSTITVLYGDIAGGATTVNKTYIAPTDNYRIMGDDGAKVVLKLTNTAAMTAITHFAQGVVYNARLTP